LPPLVAGGLVAAAGIFAAALNASATQAQGSIGPVAVVDSRAGIVVRAGAASDADSIRLVNQTTYPLSAIADQRAMFSMDAGERRTTPCTRPVYLEIYRDGWLVFASEVQCGQQVVLAPVQEDSR
jgi:hypothetical protein